MSPTPHPELAINEALMTSFQSPRQAIALHPALIRWRHECLTAVAGKACESPRMLVPLWIPIPEHITRLSCSSKLRAGNAALSIRSDAA